MGLAERFAREDHQSALAEQFETFWSAYPRRVSKAAARKAFPCALRKTTLATMLTAIEDYVRCKPAYQDFAHPATWLNGERWDDEWETDIRPAQRIVSPEFEALWKAYPIRDAEDHAGALAAFEAAPIEDRPLILQAATWLKGTLPASFEPTYAEKRKFIPSLKTWLSERRYESKRQFWEASRKSAAAQG